MHLIKGALFAGLFCMPFSLVHAACDHFALAANFLFCWQQADGPGEHCKVSNNSIACDAQDNVPGHQGYVDLITKSYSEQDAKGLTAVYLTCQRRNPRAQELIRSPTYCAADADIIRAVRHIIACYQPIRDGIRISDGSQPNWNEAEKVGISKCSPL